MAVSMDEIKELRAKTFAGIGLCKEALEKSDGDMEKAIKYVNKRSDVVGRLYNLTGAKIGQCKIAFQEAEEDFEKAVEIIKERGWEGDTSAIENESKEGVLGVYVHGNDQKIASIVEVFCDTDFVARNEEFRALAKELAMQVAALGAKYADKESVPEDIVKAEKELIKKSGDLDDKPENVAQKITEGKMQKFYEQNCLVEQNYFRDDSKKIQDLIDEALSKLGEKIEIGRIYRVELGS